MNGPTVLHHVEDMIMRMFQDGELISTIREEFTPDDFFDDEAIVEWVTDNRSPDDVFNTDVLCDWFIENQDVRDYVDIAEEACNCYTPSELYGEDYLQEYLFEMYADDLREQALQDVKDSMDPDEVFEEDELEQWARDNGFIKEDECLEPNPEPQPGHIE
jgi:hypothetical protein